MMQIHIDFDKIEFEGQVIYKPDSISCVKWERFWEGAGNPYSEREVSELEKVADDLQSEVQYWVDENETLEQEKEDLEQECERLERIIKAQEEEIASLGENFDKQYEDLIILRKRTPNFTLDFT